MRRHEITITEVRTDDPSVEKITLSDSLLELLIRDPVCGRSDYSDLPGARANARAAWRSFVDFPHRRSSISTSASNRRRSPALADDQQRRKEEARLRREKLSQRREERRARQRAQVQERRRQQQYLDQLQQENPALEKTDGALSNPGLIISSSPYRGSPAKSPRRDYRPVVESETPDKKKSHILNLSEKIEVSVREVLSAGNNSMDEIVSTTSNKEFKNKSQEDQRSVSKPTLSLESMENIERVIDEVVNCSSQDSPDTINYDLLEDIDSPLMSSKDHAEHLDMSYNSEDSRDAADTDDISSSQLPSSSLGPEVSSTTNLEIADADSSTPNVEKRRMRKMKRINYDETADDDEDRDSDAFLYSPVKISKTSGRAIKPVQRVLEKAIVDASMIKKPKKKKNSENRAGSSSLEANCVTSSVSDVSHENIQEANENKILEKAGSVPVTTELRTSTESISISSAVITQSSINQSCTMSVSHTFTTSSSAPYASLSLQPTSEQVSRIIPSGMVLSSPCPQQPVLSPVNVFPCPGEAKHGYADIQSTGANSTRPQLQLDLINFLATQLSPTVALTGVSQPEPEQAQQYYSHSHPSTLLPIDCIPATTSTQQNISRISVTRGINSHHPVSPQTSSAHGQPPLPSIHGEGLKTDQTAHSSPVPPPNFLLEPQTSRELSKQLVPHKSGQADSKVTDGKHVIPAGPSGGSHPAPVPKSHSGPQQSQQGMAKAQNSIPHPSHPPQANKNDAHKHSDIVNSQRSQISSAARPPSSSKKESQRAVEAMLNFLATAEGMKPIIHSGGVKVTGAGKPRSSQSKPPRAHAQESLTSTGAFTQCSKSNPPQSLSQPGFSQAQLQHQTFPTATISAHQTPREAQPPADTTPWLAPQPHDKLRYLSSPTGLPLIPPGSKPPPAHQNIQGALSPKFIPISVPSAHQNSPPALVVKKPSPSMPTYLPSNIPARVPISTAANSFPQTSKAHVQSLLTSRQPCQQVSSQIGPVSTENVSETRKCQQGQVSVSSHSAVTTPRSVSHLLLSDIQGHSTHKSRMPVPSSDFPVNSNSMHFQYPSDQRRTSLPFNNGVENAQFLRQRNGGGAISEGQGSRMIWPERALIPPNVSHGLPISDSQSVLSHKPSVGRTFDHSLKSQTPVRPQMFEQQHQQLSQGPFPASHNQRQRPQRQYPEAASLMQTQTQMSRPAHQNQVRPCQNQPSSQFRMPGPHTSHVSRPSVLAPGPPRSRFQNKPAAGPRLESFSRAQNHFQQPPTAAAVSVPRPQCWPRISHMNLPHRPALRPMQNSNTATAPSVPCFPRPLVPVTKPTELTVSHQPTDVKPVRSALLRALDLSHDQSSKSLQTSTATPAAQPPLQTIAQSRAQPPVLSSHPPRTPRTAYDYPLTKTQIKQEFHCQVNDSLPSRTSSGYQPSVKDTRAAAVATGTNMSVAEGRAVTAASRIVSGPATATGHVMRPAVSQVSAPASVANAIVHHMPSSVSSRSRSECRETKSLLDHIRIKQEKHAEFEENMQQQTSSSSHLSSSDPLSTSNPSPSELLTGDKNITQTEPPQSTRTMSYPLHGNQTTSSSTHHITIPPTVSNMNHSHERNSQSSLTSSAVCELGETYHSRAIHPAVVTQPRVSSTGVLPPRPVQIKQELVSHQASDSSTESLPLPAPAGNNTALASVSGHHRPPARCSGELVKLLSVQTSVSSSLQLSKSAPVTTASSSATVSSARITQHTLVQDCVSGVRTSSVTIPSVKTALPQAATTTTATTTTITQKSPANIAVNPSLSARSACSLPEHMRVKKENMAQMQEYGKAASTISTQSESSKGTSVADIPEHIQSMINSFRNRLSPHKAPPVSCHLPEHVKIKVEHHARSSDSEEEDETEDVSEAEEDMDESCSESETVANSVGQDSSVPDSSMTATTAQVRLVVTVTTINNDICTQSLADSVSPNNSQTQPGVGRRQPSQTKASTKDDSTTVTGQSDQPPGMENRDISDTRSSKFYTDKMPQTLPEIVLSDKHDMTMFSKAADHSTSTCSSQDLPITSPAKALSNSHAPVVTSTSAAGQGLDISVTVNSNISHSLNVPSQNSTMDSGQDVSPNVRSEAKSVISNSRPQLESSDLVSQGLPAPASDVTDTGQDLSQTPALTDTVVTSTIDNVSDLADVLSSTELGSITKPASPMDLSTEPLKSVAVSTGYPLSHPQVQTPPVTAVQQSDVNSASGYDTLQVQSSSSQHQADKVSPSESFRVAKDSTDGSRSQQMAEKKLAIVVPPPSRTVSYSSQEDPLFAWYTLSPPAGDRRILEDLSKAVPVPNPGRTMATLDFGPAARNLYTVTVSMPGSECTTSNSYGHVSPTSDVPTIKTEVDSEIHLNRREVIDLSDEDDEDSSSQEQEETAQETLSASPLVTSATPLFSDVSRLPHTVQVSVPVESATVSEVDIKTPISSTPPKSSVTSNFTVEVAGSNKDQVSCIGNPGTETDLDMPYKTENNTDTSMAKSYTPQCISDSVSASLVSNSEGLTISIMSNPSTIVATSSSSGTAPTEVKLITSNECSHTASVNTTQRPTEDNTARENVPAAPQSQELTVSRKESSLARKGNAMEPIIIDIDDESDEDNTEPVSNPNRLSTTQTAGVGTSAASSSSPRAKNLPSPAPSSGSSTSSVGVSHRTPLGVGKTLASIGSWSAVEVSDWLKGHKLDKICPNLSNLDSRGLQRMAFEYHNDPDMFYKRVKRTLGLSIFHMMVICSSMRELTDPGVEDC